MRKLFKPACLLFYLLVFLSFFIIGTTFAVLIDAAKDQGLAGSAIVLGYGVLFGFFAILISFFMVLYMSVKSIIKINRILSILLFLIILVLTIRVYTRSNSGSANAYQKHIQETGRCLNQSVVTTNQQQNALSTLGLSFFKPDFLAFTVIYFYGNPNIYKLELNPTPSDSIVFGKTDYGNFEIIYAPPWFLPEILKMDYDMFFLRLNSVGNEFVEVVVNNKTQQTAFIKRFQGEVIYWPDFLLRAHSVEMLPGKIQPVRIKALNHAAEINVDHEFMKPLMVNNEWLYVELQKLDFQSVGKGWIQWREGDILLIAYSLLS